MKRIKAFTLVELLVVILIIGVLATLVILSLSSSVKKSKDARAKDSIKKVQTALTQKASESTGTLEASFSPAPANLGTGLSLTADTLVSTTGDKFFTSIPKDATDAAIKIKVSGDRYAIYGNSTGTGCWYLTASSSNLADPTAGTASCNPDAS